jgi:hypothetical protein
MLGTQSLACEWTVAECVFKGTVGEKVVDHANLGARALLVFGWLGCAEYFGNGTRECSRKVLQNHGHREKDENSAIRHH